MKIAVVTDSGSNYREEGYDVEGIFCVPLTISDENRTYLMGEELSVEETYKMVQAGKMLKTIPFTNTGLPVPMKCRFTWGTALGRWLWTDPLPGWEQR